MYSILILLQNWVIPIRMPNKTAKAEIEISFLSIQLLKELK